MNGESYEQTKRTAFVKTAARIIIGLALSAAAYGARNEALKAAAYAAALVVLAQKVVVNAAAGLRKGEVFDENFLMLAAASGAVYLGEYAEALFVMLFFAVGEGLCEAAVTKSENAIGALVNLKADYANVYVNGVLTRVSPDAVRAGETIVVKPGEAFPLDGVITKGAADIDTSAITGETAPRFAEEGDAALSGCVNLNGLVEARVTNTADCCAAAKIAALIEASAQNKSETEKFLTRFAKIYTPSVCAAALLIAFLPPLLFGGGGVFWLNYALVLLVISCPCSLVLSVPLCYFGGIGACSKFGVLLKGGNFLDALCDVKTAVFDKTGTLTTGAFEVTEVCPANGADGGYLLKTAAEAEFFSNHPAARAVLNAAGACSGSAENFREIPGRGVSADVGGRAVLAGNFALMRENGVKAQESDKNGIICYVAEGGAFLGSVVLNDAVKPDARKTVAAFNGLGVRTVMLTGDGAGALRVAEALGVGECFYSLMPGGKAAKVSELKKSGTLLFAGDGLNDAPAAKAADIGAAMGVSGSQATVAAADMVILNDSPYAIVSAVFTARRVRRAVYQNTVFSLGVKLVFLILGGLSLTGIKFVGMKWAVFADAGVCCLAVLNALRALRGRRRD